MRVEQAEHVVVRLHEESRRLGEGRVLCQNPRIDVPVRRDDGQTARFLVQRPRDAPHRGIRVEIAILGEDNGLRTKRRAPSPARSPAARSASPRRRPKCGRAWIGPQRATGPLRDVAEMAQQHTLRAFGDWLGYGRAGADRVHKVRDVLPRQLIVAARRERIGARGFERLFDDLVVEVVHGVAILVDQHASGGAVYNRPAPALLGREGVAAQPLPHDGALPVELEARLLCVGELPVVFEMVPPADRGDARRVVHAQRPAGDVELVGPVVADLARPPALEPVPVVVDDVVAIGGARRRALPQLVVEVRGDGHTFAATDRLASIRIPGLGEVGATDDAVPDRLHGLDAARSGAPLRAHLDDAPGFPLRFDQ